MLSYRYRLMPVFALIMLFFCFGFPKTGFTDEKPKKQSITGNLKICFIIDTSDSMNRDLRFVRVKKALFGFLDSLIANDYFIVVTFDRGSFLKYSGLVGDKSVKEAIKRVFDSSYPDGEKVKGMASEIMSGTDRALSEIEKTPPYQSTAVVFFTDGDHNPKPDNARWNELCEKYRRWASEPEFKDTRSLYVVDVGDPKNSKIMADDLGVAGDNYFPYSEETDFAKILEKIRSKIPYSYSVRVFPSQLDLGTFDEPSGMSKNRLFFLCNSEFFDKGGCLIPKISVEKDGKKLENPPFSLELPQRISTEFYSEEVRLKTAPGGIPPGSYRALITFDAGGPLNTRLNVLNEEGRPVDAGVVTFAVTAPVEKGGPAMIISLIFLVVLIFLLAGVSAYVKNMPSVRGKLIYKDSAGFDGAPQEADLFIPVRHLIFSGGRSVVGVGTRAQVNLSGIPFLEAEHFQIEAESANSYKIRPLSGLIEILDARENPRGSGGSLKNGYVVKILDRENPETWVSFRFENRMVN